MRIFALSASWWGKKGQRGRKKGEGTRNEANMSLPMALRRRLMSDVALLFMSRSMPQTARQPYELAPQLSRQLFELVDWNCSLSANWLHDKFKILWGRRRNKILLSLINLVVRGEKRMLSLLPQIDKVQFVKQLTFNSWHLHASQQTQKTFSFLFVQHPVASCQLFPVQTFNYLPSSVAKCSLKWELMPQPWRVH